MRHNEILPDQEIQTYKPETFGYETCASMHSYGPAVRTYWLLHYVVSGKGKFEREKHCYELCSGDIFVIPPYLETYYEADEDDPWTYIWISFSVQGEISPCFKHPIIHCPEAKQVFEEMKLCSRRDKGKNAFLVAKLWELISILSSEGSDGTSYVETALRYMKNEYMNPISVAELSHRLGLDRSYFSSLFKEQLGISPGKYLLNLRLSIAAELITKHDTSPTTAAISCGFSDIYHFSKAFKKQFGLSPRAYLKEYKKDPTVKSDPL